MSSRLAVVGLLPGQAKRIAQEFPTSGLKFVPRDREREVPAITAAFDTVIVMTKFISHQTWHQIPRAKLKPINGGLSDLRRQLQRLLPGPPKEQPKKPTPQVNLKPNAMPDTDYTPLKTAEPGEVILFPRPEDIPIALFEKQVTAARSYYRRHHQLETEQRTTDKGIEVTVNGTLGTTKRPAKPVVGEAGLWSQVYVGFIAAQPGASDEFLVERADAAVAAYKQRFG